MSDIADGYVAYFGLTESPFRAPAVARFRHDARMHAAARAELAEALERRDAVILVIGESGTGKTMLCRSVVQGHAGPTRWSFVVNPSFTFGDLVKQIVTDFDVIPEEALQDGTLALNSSHDLIVGLEIGRAHV